MLSSLIIARKGDDKRLHYLSKTKMRQKKAQAIEERFSAQFFMFSEIVCSVLLTVFHLKILLIGWKFSTANQDPLNVFKE